MIKLLILDVDGCLSDGKITYDANGVETKSFDVKDGLGVSTWNKLGNQTAIITGRKSTIVSHRAKELGVTHLFQGVDDKDRVLKELVASLGLEFEEVAAIGDDLNDYKMLKLVGRSFTPNNGVQEIKEIVDTVLSKNGGNGAVREMVNMLIENNNQKDDFMQFWMNK